MKLLLLVILLVVYSAQCFLQSRFRFGYRLRPLSSSKFPVIDISPYQNGGIMKQIIRRGNEFKGKPFKDDHVDLDYRISLLNGTVVRDKMSPYSGNDTSPFRFKIGMSPKHISLGIDLAVQSMVENELAQFTLTPEYFYGSEGIKNMIPGDVSVVMDIHLIEIIPNILRSFPVIKNGSQPISNEELMDKLHGNAFPDKAEEATERIAYQRQQIRQLQLGKESLPVTSVDTPQDSPVIVTQSPESANNNNLTVDYSLSNVTLAQAIRPHPSVRFFDPTTQQLDPNRRVTGEGDGHIWDEVVSVIEIQVPLGDTEVLKDQVEVSIEPRHISVKKDGVTLLDGPLEGKVLPSQSAWVIAEPDPTIKYTGYRVVLNLEKSHLSSDIWGTVFSKDYLQSKLNNK